LVRGASRLSFEDLLYCSFPSRRLFNAHFERRVPTPILEKLPVLAHTLDKCIDAKVRDLPYAETTAEEEYMLAMAKEALGDTWVASTISLSYRRAITLGEL